MAQPSVRPLIAEIEQLRRSVDSMNSQTAEMLKNLESLRHIGADHMCLPSSEQEKLDREWEYFETVCDQVYFILENAKYKLKRQQGALLLQLDPPPPSPPQEKPATPEQPLASTTTANIAIDFNTTALANDTLQSTDQSTTAPQSIPQETTISHSTTTELPQLQNENSPFDFEMMSPPINLDSNADSTQISTASLLSSTTPVLNQLEQSIMDDSLVTEEDKFQDTMLDLGDIGNLGELGDMDDMINF
ncbi:hypothetical protein BGZ54_008978 [Gamsiella multidivaricata]|nr:hypothetical protein BGZ54_008978 [Gamsiella multidivaricata]